MEKDDAITNILSLIFSAVFFFIYIALFIVLCGFLGDEND